jgi:soluble lytic murein transglycosylase-like protein
MAHGFRHAFFLTLLVLTVESVALADSVKLKEFIEPGIPKLKVSLDPSVAKCLVDKANPNTPLRRSAVWELTCEREDFLRAANNLRVKGPGLRLLVGKVLHQELLKLRSTLGVATPPATLDVDAPTSDVVAGQATLEVEFLKQSEDIIKSAAEWLTPLFQDPKRRDLVLNFEGAFELFTIYGDGFRFARAKALIASQQNLLLRKGSAENRVVDQVLMWIENYGNPSLRDWLQERLVLLRPSDITGAREVELKYWTKSLLLAPFPKDKASRDFVLTKLRELAVAYPKTQHLTQIQDVAERLGLGTVFKVPNTQSMTLPELMIRAQAQVKAVDTLGALRTMRRLQKLPDASFTKDDLWDALQYHVKVLRILDERPQIPGMIQAYIRKGKFLDLPTDKKEYPVYFSRLHQIAKFYWNYDTPERAGELIDKIITLNQKVGGDFSLGSSLVVKARIAEQARNVDQALILMDDALKVQLPRELRDDLLWRRLFLEIDRSSKTASYETLAPYLEAIKKNIVDKDPGEKGRYFFWLAQSQVLAKKNDDALASFQKAYASETFSYYSNMAGLELSRMGQAPRDWSLFGSHEPIKYDERRWSTPNWELYFSESGDLRSPLFRDLARSYFLASIGDWQGASNTFSDLDRSVWQYVLPSRNGPWPKRRDFARAVSWLRIALDDPMGGLRATEVARQAGGLDFEEEDVLSLYPLPFWKDIQAGAAEAKIDPWLAASLIRQESAFNPKARSWANALGLMQMIPPVAREEAKIVGLKPFDIDDLYNPSVALRLGTNHLSRLLTSFESSWICSIGAYNAGSPPVQKWLGFYKNDYPLTFVERIPFKETQNYVKSILRNYINYQRIYSKGEVHFETLVRMPQSLSSSKSALVSGDNAPQVGSTKK